MMRFSKTIVLAFIGLTSLSIVSSCNRKKDTIGKVYVYDVNGNPVTGSQVVLYPKPSEPTNKTMILADTAITNLEGEAIFNFNELYKKGQAGVVVLNIKATKDTLVGTGVIQIIEETTSDADVYLQ